MTTINNYKIISTTRLKRYTDNCSIAEVQLDNGYIGDYVKSYDTLVALIDHSNKTLTELGWWSATTSKHINYVAQQLGYKVNR